VKINHPHQTHEYENAGSKNEEDNHKGEASANFGSHIRFQEKGAPDERKK
jgi:hypothetical protein